MAGRNAVTLTFAGDASALDKAAARAAAATESVGDAAARASGQTTQAGRAADAYGDRMGRVGAAAAGMSAAVGDAGGSVSALAALQNRSADRAQAQARALADVEQAGLDASQAMGDLRQAQIDLTQSQIDARQAGVDAKQAILDQKQAGIDAASAQRDYNAAVKEHGKNSIEARQAAQDLAQAHLDLEQAGVDAATAQNDLRQFQEDGAQAGRDMAQASRDAKDAQLNLNDAQRAADPSTLTRVGTEVELVSTAALGLVGTLNLLAMANNAVSLSSARAAAAAVGSRVALAAGAVATGIATAAQWAYNIALSANPIGLVVIAIAGLVAGIVWVATKTTWFQDLWKAIWSKIGDPVKAAWEWVKNATESLFKKFDGFPGRLKSAFSTVANILVWPFKAAFNSIAVLWNATVGKLSFTLPGWVPGIGGAGFSMPKLPTFHTGGRVPGAPGTEVPIMALAGETVLPPGRSAAGPAVVEFRVGGTAADAWFADMLMRSVVRRPDVRVTIRTAVT